MEKGRKKIKRWYLPALAVLVFVLTRIMVRFPEITEHTYSRGIYPYLAVLISFFSQWISFSLDDLFYFSLILLVFILIVLLIFKKIKFRKAGKIIINVLSLVFVLFYFLWGFNYFREDLNTRLNIPEQETNKDEFIQIFEELVTKTNNSFTTYKDFDVAEIDRLVEESYKNLSPALEIKYPSGKRKPKNITLSSFFAKAGITGYYGPFLNEVHINKNILPVEYPFVLAHEKAHQFGITSEAEANFYAWMVCSQSDSKELNYSANITTLRYFMSQGSRLEEYDEITNNIDESVRDDFRRIRTHWSNLRDEKVDKVATKVNDTYLKTNKVEKGIEDYRGVVKYVMDFSLDTPFQKKYNLAPF